MKDDNITKEQLLKILAEARELILKYENSVLDSKQLKDILRENEERYRIYFSLANDIMFTFDTQLKVLSVSPNIEQVLGYKPDELIGKHFVDLNLISPEDISEAIDNAQYVLTGGTIQSAIFQFITKDGTRKFGEVRGFPLKRDNRVMEVVNVAWDITRRIEMENSLRENSDIYQNILKSMPTAISIVRIRDARYLYVNDAFLKITGYSPEETNDKTPYDLNLPVESEDIDHCFKVIKNKKTIDSMKHKCRKKDGIILDTILSAGPVHYGGEDCMLIVITPAPAVV